MPVPMRGGKLYNTVNERLEAAHGDGAQPSGIKSVRTEICPAGQVTIVRATVTFADERVFVGMSEIKFDATSGADKDAPVECAETSAVGRALAFAGYYGSDTGLAGAEEVRSASLRQENRERAPGVATNGAARVNADLRPRPAPVVHEPPEDDAPFPEPEEPRAPGGRPNGQPAAYLGAAPASPKQVQTIARMSRAVGKTINTEGMSRAQASDIITGLISEMGAAR